MAKPMFGERPGQRATLVGLDKHRVRFEGSITLALRVATTLADADGVELISSDQPLSLGDGTVALNVMVAGEFDAVVDAVAGIRREMPPRASIEITGG
jgi:hypothetical protein